MTSSCIERNLIQLVNLLGYVPLGSIWLAVGYFGFVCHNIPNFLQKTKINLHLQVIFTHCWHNLWSTARHLWWRVRMSHTSFRMSHPFRRSVSFSQIILIFSVRFVWSSTSTKHHTQSVSISKPEQTNVKYQTPYCLDVCSLPLHLESTDL